MMFVRELGEFLWAVINNWAGYATGGLIVALVWLWSTVKQGPVSRKFGIGLAILFLFFAVFNAWRDKQHELLALQERLTPKLEMIVSQRVWGGMGRTRQKLGWGWSFGYRLLITEQKVSPMTTPPNWSLQMGG